MNRPSGIWFSFTRRWSKVEGGLAEERFRGEAWGKMGDRDFFHSDKDPFDPAGSRRIHAASLQVDTGHRTGDASTARFLSHPSTTVVITRLQTDSKELTPTIHGHLAKASVLTAVAIATASHTHMCGIRGQGSWVVLGGLNGALCVIIQTSSNPRLAEGHAKKKKKTCRAVNSSLFSKTLWLESSFF